MELSQPSFRRHAGKISSNWLLTGDYGLFLNRNRISAWRYLFGQVDIPKGRVIDLGCADGSWAQNWKDLGFSETCGIDINVEAVREAAKVMHQVYCGDSSTLSSIDGARTLVAAQGVLVHILEENEIEKFVSDVYRNLNPGGFFVASILDSSHYLSPEGFVPWTGPLSCTRSVEESLAMLTAPGFELVNRVGTFINPWFCSDTAWIANDSSVKSSLELFTSMTLLGDVMRTNQRSKLFSEYLVCLRKPL